MICGVTEANANTFKVPCGVQQFDIEGIDVRCIGGQYSNSMGFYQRIAAFGAFARQATRIGFGIKSDVVFASSTPLTVGIPGMKIAKKWKSPFVFEVRDLWPEVPIALGVLRNPLLKFYAKRLERRIYSAANHVVALSPGMKDGVCKVGYTDDSVTMIPNGCDLDLFCPSEDKSVDSNFGEPNDFRLVFAGAHGLANGLDAILDAALVLKQRNVSGVRFVFIGLGKTRDALIARGKREGTDSLITWLPYISKSELAAVLPKMNVGLMPLKNIPEFYYGTSPNKFFDYISSGLPVLNNYPGWVADMIQDHSCGLVVPPDDPVAFADAVLQMRDAAVETKEMGVRARSLAESDFDRKQLSDRFVDVIENAYSSASQHRPAFAEVPA